MLVSYREELKKEFLRMLREDDAFRAEVTSMLAGGILEREEIRSLTKEIRNLAEKISAFTEETRKTNISIQKEIENANRRLDAFEREMTKFREESAKRMDAFEKEMMRLREESAKRMDAFEKEMEMRIKLSEERLRLLEESVEEFRRFVIGGLGARWGLASEEAFRDGLRGLMERYGVKVSKWEYYDSECVVFRRPSMVEVDVLIRDEEHVLVEIKSSVSKEDVEKFLDKASLYERVKKVKPSLVIISPFVHPKAEEYAKENNVKVYTSVREFVSR